MKANVTWDKDMIFTCRTDTGHTLTMDGQGGTLTPMESVLLAVGACSSIDVVEIMKKARQAIDGCHCELTAQRAESDPKVFTAIHAIYHVKGENLNEKHLRRAIELSTEKYCSVMLMLKGNVRITSEYTLTA